MRHQRRVGAFVEEHGLAGTPPHRALDLASEVGEIAKEVTQSADYGMDPDAVEVAADEIGDALFSLLALAESLDIDAGMALDEAMGKYRGRFADYGETSSPDETDVTHYHKLVRDRIPERIEADGDRPVTSVVGEEAYGDLLGAKLVEEAAEYRESGDPEELADVLEVVAAARAHAGLRESELADVRAEKAAERGRFEQRIVLEAVRRTDG